MTALPVKKVSSGFTDFLSDVSQMLDAWQTDSSQTVRNEGLWHPAMDMYHFQQDIVVVLEIAGMDPKKIQISIEEDHLYVEGERTPYPEFKETARYYSERAIGGFHRVVHLPRSVNPDKVKAEYHDGLLVVTLPKKDRAKGKKVEVSC
jgi:HSP20 family protein